jgi:DNA invertase Pin-like site-specific DNA recombinase
MDASVHQKVTVDHLRRDAYLYVRQSTLRQVFENTESTKRQYALRDRAVALGWPVERVVVVDSDLGRSGASAEDREGFQRLVAAVGMGQVGIVLGLEVSRLARSSSDWHRLLEICALTRTLILDEDGIYDPSHFNDRLLLGLKGTMSEAELHVLRARLLGGIRNKARRGELKAPLPVGFAYGPDSRVVLDPDQQVQQSIRLLFETFRRTGSASSTVATFRTMGWLFPRRPRVGPRTGDLLWVPLGHWRALQLLKNPRYAGAFFFGRRQSLRTADGKQRSHALPPDQWQALIPNAHPGYISWEEYEENLRCLRENAQAHGAERRKSPPREGPALLQGLAVCGVCGDRMTVRYHSRHGQITPDYICQRRRVALSEPVCQHLPGAAIDQAIGDLLIETMTPMALEVALTVQQELVARSDQADRLRQQQVERARYEADLAGRRYMRVDPDNRLVADALEADWNHKLRALGEAQRDYEQQCRADRLTVDERQRAEILALATDFPRLWRAPDTLDRDRKRLVRLMLEDVTLMRGEGIAVHVRFKGGGTRTLALPFPKKSWQMSQTETAVVREIDKLLDSHTDGEIAAILNQEGYRSGQGKDFDRRIVGRIRRSYNLRDRLTRLRATGLLTLEEYAAAVGVRGSTARRWRQWGLLAGHKYDDRGACLYDPPGPNSPKRGTWKRPRRPKTKSLSDRPVEVQYGVQPLVWALRGRQRVMSIPTRSEKSRNLELNTGRPATSRPTTTTLALS